MLDRRVPVVKLAILKFLHEQGIATANEIAIRLKIPSVRSNLWYMKRQGLIQKVGVVKERVRKETLWGITMTGIDRLAFYEVIAQNGKNGKKRFV